MKKTNQFFKFGFTLCASLIIAACSSSSSNDDNKKDDTKKPTVTTPTKTPIKTSTNTNTSTTISSGTGQVTVISDDDSAVAKAGNKVVTKSINQAQLNSITVDGKTIQLQYPGIYSNGWFNNSNARFELKSCCGKYSSVKFGAYEDEENSYMFYNGIPTAQNQIPTSGTFNYTGDSIYAPGNDRLEEDYYTGTASLAANFADKTVKGQLVNEAASISIDAKISQNGFTGTARSTAETSTAAVEGKFYGANAAEIGGMATAKGKDSWGAAFAGKR